MLDPAGRLAHAWGMSRYLLVLVALLVLIPTAAPAEEEETTPAEEEPAPLELDLSWNPTSSADADFTWSEQAAASPATLRVLCTTDGARVIVDGEAYGEAPKVISGLEPGAHTVTVELPSGRSLSRQILLRGGMVEELTVHPAGSRDEDAAFVIRTISTILATLVAIPATSTQSARLARETEMPGLITNFDVLEPVPQE